MGYAHTQKSPLGWVFGAIAAGLGIAAWAMRGQPLEAIVVWLVALVSVFLAGSFARLKVEDAGEALQVRFGPLGILGTRIPYAAIRAVDAGRSAIIDGWGIHWVPWRGWTYNLWGRQCVRIQTERGVVRVGTDDAQNLARFLKARAAA